MEKKTYVGFSSILDCFFRDKDGVYDAVLPGARCHAGSPQRSLNYRSLSDYSSSVVIHVGWISYHAEDFNFLGFSRRVGNVCVLYAEQPNFLVSSTSSTDLPFRLIQRCFCGEGTSLISPLASVPSFSAT